MKLPYHLLFFVSMIDGNQILSESASKTLEIYIHARYIFLFNVSKIKNI